MNGSDTDARSLTKQAGSVRIAILCRHDFSHLEPGDKLHTYDKIRALATQVDVTLFLPRGYAAREMQSHMKIVQVSQGLFFALGLVLALFIHRDEYDCVYSRDPLLMPLAAPMKAFGKILVIEMNGIPSLWAEIHRRSHRIRAPQLTPIICALMHQIEALAIRFADLVFPVTERMRETLLRDYGADPGKIIVVPNTVDTDAFRPLEAGREETRSRLGIERKTVVLYFGTFTARWRGTDQLFHVANLVLQRREDIVFLVVGSGPLLEGIGNDAVGSRALSRVLQVGSVDHHLVPLYLNAADVYVYDLTQAAVGLIEKQGLCPSKILEAMACGKPVITPKESELESMLQKSGGGLSASSMKELVELIEKLTDSPGLVKSMGVKARQYVELNHDLTRLTQRMVELINETVSSRRE